MSADVQMARPVHDIVSCKKIYELVIVKHPLPEIRANHIIRTRRMGHDHQRRVLVHIPEIILDEAQDLFVKTILLLSPVIPPPENIIYENIAIVR